MEPSDLRPRMQGYLLSQMKCMSVAGLSLAGKESREAFAGCLLCAKKSVRAAGAKGKR